MRALICLFFIQIPIFWIISSVNAQTFTDAIQRPCIQCEELKNLDFPEVIVSEATKVDNTISFCRVMGTIGNEINFELLLPMEWNERFVMGGGGGYVGSIQNAARSKLNEGYATVGTDTGHKGNGRQASWAYLNAERQVNFGHLAVHRTAVVSKAIINQFYGTYPRYSYFMGCSRGGGQAMMEAQRYPDDFDGIVAGAPIIDWPATMAEFVQNSQILYPDPSNLTEPLLTQEHLSLLQAAVLDQCDSIDGLTDQIINDPRDCHFDFSNLPMCAGEFIGKDCFTSTQINAIKMIYSGVASQDSMIYPGFPFGGEGEQGSWLNWIVGTKETALTTGYPSAQFAFGTEFIKYFVFHDPDWDYTTYDFSNFTKDTRFAAAFLNATSTDYSKFKNRGGKMIIYHGWNDPALSALTLTEHYDAAREKDLDLENYIRLFLLPGVLHCQRGAGPDRADWLGLVRNWVENNVAPERVIVSKIKDGEVKMTRPVFPYPSVTLYNGFGDPNIESSFYEKH